MTPSTSDRRDSTQPSLLAASELSKVFTSQRGLRKAPALNAVSLSVDERASVAVVGESGSGKSTLLRLLAGIEILTSGTITFGGVDLAQAPKAVRREYRRRVQMIFQDPFASLNPVHRVEHHLRRPLISSGRASDRETLERLTRELLESVGLSSARELRQRFPHELSGGQRQRVAIARALASEPRVLLADEPTSMLDVSIRTGILNLFERLRREDGIALLYVTHDIASARYVASELKVMYAGYLVEEGPSDELLSAPAHPYTRRLLAAVPGSGLAPWRTANPDAGAEIAVQGRGCPFRPHCSRAVERCSDVMPTRTALSESRIVRCHAPLE